MPLTASRQASSGQTSVSPFCEAKKPARRVRVLTKACANYNNRGVAAVAANTCSSSTAVLPANSVARAPDLQLQYPTSEFILDAEASYYDILGLAQSMVDVTTEVDDGLLSSLGVEKGGRRVLSSVDERSRVMATIEEAGSTFKITPGGSLANTLVAISRLSKASDRSRLSVALGSTCSTDAVGQFFSSQMNNAGVAVLPTSDEGGHTGTVFVLASPDGNRSFLSFFQSEHMNVSSQLRHAVLKSRLVVIEGYLWELPNAASAIAEVVEIARSTGAQIALTAGDPGVMARHREEILQVLDGGGQNILLFANKEEASELCGQGRLACARTAAAELGSLCSLAVVTDGANGSHISCMGQIQSVPPPMAPQGVVDTCGAGDAYAAGFCYALMMGHDFATAGSFGSSVAARVIGRHGAQLLEEEAESLVKVLPQVYTLARQ